MTAVVDGIKTAISAKKQSELTAWKEESLKSCSHTENLVQVLPRKLEGKGI